MGDPTARDRVWRAMLETGRHGSALKVERVHREIPREHRPSTETVRRVMAAATELGVLKHKSGSPYYRLTDDFRR